MVTILHGDDIASSRRELERIKFEDKAAEIVILAGKDLTKTTLIQALESKSLFAPRRLVMIENFFAKKVKEEILDYLRSQEKEANIVFWEEKVADVKIFKKYFLKAHVLEFKLPPRVFHFLDSLRPGNFTNALTLLTETLDLRYEPSFVFYLLVRHIRRLILAKDGALNFLKKEGLADWQIKKLERQTSYFSLESLIKIYQRLLEIDSNQKTGQGSLNLKESLEFLVLGI